MENILKYIKAVQADAGNVGLRSPIQMGKEIEGNRYQNPIVALSGPRNNFEGMIVQDFKNRAQAGIDAQDKAVYRTTLANLDDDDSRKSVLQALGNKQLSSSFTKEDAARQYVTDVLYKDDVKWTPRTKMIQANTWAAKNPQVVIPAGVGAATLGTTALLTASGQALAQLTNNMNQSLATEANRENVLTS